MYQEVHTDDIAARAHASEIGDLLRLFEAQPRRDGAVSYESFAADVMEPFGDDLMVMEPTGDGDYLWTRYGREIVRYAGGSRLGERVSALRPQVARFTKACLDRTLAEMRPLYTVHRSKRMVRVSLWERLLLPTIAANGRPVLVAFSRPLQFREDLLGAVMRSSPCGIVALRAVRDPAGEIVRTFILTANQRASELTGQPHRSLVDLDARDALPFLADPTNWYRCLLAIGRQRADSLEIAFEQAGRTVWLQIAIAPLGDGLLLTLTDITDLTLANQTLQLRAATLALEIGRERATRRALSEEIGYREEREQELRRLAETDPLTALLNRRSFAEKAGEAIAAAETDGTGIALIIIDLDHFKRINDAHGHPAGDAVIRAFADLLLGLFRGEDALVGRFGGEEFAVLLRAEPAVALARTRRIQEMLAARALPVSETLELTVTASCGIASRHEREPLPELVGRADRALYSAKHGGRNRIALADSEKIAAAA